MATTQHVYNLRPSTPDTRDFLYSSPTRRVMPVSFDLSRWSPPVKQQGQEGSCTGQMISTMKETLMKIGGNWQQLSPAFPYYLARQIESDPTQDAGANIADVMSIALHTGICPERDMPYGITPFSQPPSAQAMQEAANFKIQAYHRVLSLNLLRAAIVNMQPVGLGILCFEGIEQPGAGAIISMPTQGEAPLGGHAITCIGYDDKAQLVRLRNSWGAEYGLGGDCFMPYLYVTNPQLCFEMWTIA